METNGVRCVSKPIVPLDADESRGLVPLDSFRETFLLQAQVASVTEAPSDHPSLGMLPTQGVWLCVQNNKVLVKDQQGGPLL